METDLVRLNCRVGRLGSLKEYITAQIAGKSVLHVGAVGTIDDYVPDRIAEWAHARYARVAREIDAIDIDRTRIKTAAAHGFQIDYGNCETVDLGKRYDAIVMADVIEHVEQPPRALVNLTRHLAEDGTLFVATPNPGYLSDLLRAVFNRGPHVFFDHMSLFAPEHIQAICNRHGLTLKATYFYSEIDARSRLLRVKSHLLRIAAAASPRLNQSFLAEICSSNTPH